ncbi:MAG: hypothetical protein QW403_02570 [Candidatus Aenigmatarchaeota archaeon]
MKISKIIVLVFVLALALNLIEMKKDKLVESNFTLVKAQCKPRNSTFLEYNSTTQTFKIWNDQEVYWINKTSGLQITQDLPNWWSKNWICINATAGNFKFEGICTDSFELTWTNATNEEATWVELNGTSKEYTAPGGYKFYFKVRYFLKDHDRKLSVSFYGYNTGSKAIDDLWFWWKTTEIKINNSYEDNAFVINSTLNEVEVYDLHGLDAIFNSTYLKEKKYEVHKRNYKDLVLWRIRLDWLSDYDYELNVSDEGQYNSVITLKQHIGSVAPGEEKNSEFYWEDASGYTLACNVGGTCSCNYNNYLLECTVGNCYILTSCTVSCPSPYPNSYLSSNTCQAFPASSSSCCGTFTACFG